MIIKPRWRWASYSRYCKVLVSLLLAWTVFDLINVRRSFASDAATMTPSFGNQKIFIASLHWTSEIVLRSHWAPAVTELARHIGTDKVFISIYESGSFDDTKGALQDLWEDLERAGIPNKIVLDEATHKDEVEKPPADTGWIQMPRTQTYRQNWTDWFTLEKGTWVPRRIPYLARLRNLVMEPLYELKQQGQIFDKVLWLNDVVFETDDVYRLLGTREGEYAAACALDFKHPPYFYDTFATRDMRGYEPIMDTWPYFRSAASRQAIKHGEAVPVASCWNGMVMFDAAPFYDKDQPLRFRGIADDLAISHVEGSECCLIHADNPLSLTKGVWINPNVRVTYNTSLYNAVNPRNGTPLPSVLQIVTGLWKNRISRWLSVFMLRDRTVDAKVRKWSSKDVKHREPGTFCLIDEMQIMLWNGWGHA